MAAKVTVRRIRATLRSGKRVAIPAWMLDSGKAGPCFMLTAAQHGNEVQGIEAIRRFVELAAKQMAAGRVVAVPFANPPAVRDRRPHIRMRPEQPYADDRGHNMNRTWPGRRTGNDTARVSYAVYRAFGDAATHVLDFHCWEKHGAPAVLIRDIPALRELARKLGHRFVQVRPPSSHTLGGLFCATGRVGVTYEFAGQYLVDEKQVRQGLRVVVNMAKAIGILPGRLLKGDAPVLFSDETGDLTVAAPCTGLFVEAGLELCQPVKKGQTLGHVLSDADLACRPITAPASGYLGAYGAARPHCDVALPAQHPYVSKGDRLARIVWATDKQRGAAAP